MKGALRIVTAVVVAVLVAVLLPGSTSAQKGKPAGPTELSVDFRDWPGDKIHSNNTDPFYSNQDTASYPNYVVLRSDGSLYMRIQKNQKVYFVFDEIVVDPRHESGFIDKEGKVRCQEYSLTGDGARFSYDLPAFLTPGGGQPNNEYTVITTAGMYAEDSAGAWTYSSTPFALTDIATNHTAIVALGISFHVVEQNELFGVWLAYYLWGPLPPASTGMTGIVQVTRTSEISWEVTPLPADHPIAIMRGLVANQASLSFAAPSVKRVHGGGNCDLGDWRMPFGFTLTRR